jgi:hypothetical protein
MPRGQGESSESLVAVGDGWRLFRVHESKTGNSGPNIQAVHWLTFTSLKTQGREFWNQGLWLKSEKDLGLRITFYCCCNEIPWAWRLKTPLTCDLTALEVRILKWVSEGLMHARQTLKHWAMSPAPKMIVIKLIISQKKWTTMIYFRKWLLMRKFREKNWSVATVKWLVWAGSIAHQ